MKDFLKECAELLAEDIAAGWDSTKVVLYIDMGEEIATLRGTDMQAVLVEGVVLATKSFFKCKRPHSTGHAATFHKRDQDDYWLVGLFPMFPMSIYELRVYTSNADKLPDLDDVYIPGEVLAEACDVA
jgi:surface polysaccharide O-acyltransferase-like enzyme